MSRRFNNLDAALKFLRPVNAPAGTPVPNAPEGTALRRFQQFKSGQVIVTYNRAADSRPGELNKVAIQPFALPTAATQRYSVPFSARASTRAAAFGLTSEVMGHTATNADTLTTRGFVPARAIGADIPSGAGTPTDSELTGQRYNKKATKSSTIPFGATTARPGYAAQKQFIISTVAAASGTKVVSFTPERF